LTRRLSPPLVLLATALLAGPGCAEYLGPPEITLEGADNSHLADPKAPIVLTFSKPADPATVKIEIARLTTDVEGNLGDEDSDPNTSLDVLFSTDPVEGDTGGFAVLSADGTSLKIKPSAAFPVGASLVLLIEKGFSDTAGHATTVRRKIPFSYQFDLKCDKPTTVFQSGTYFFLAVVTEPIPAQVKLFTAIDLDPATGAFVGRFTNSLRNPDPKRCSPECPADKVCSLLPTQRCVVPSERAGTVDEFPDFLPNSMPPTGFSFQSTGCVIDQPDGTTAFITAPTDVVVVSPPVTLRNTQITGSFKLVGDVLEGTGALDADDVLLGKTSSGAAAGSMSARSIPVDQVPPGVPQPEKTK
jgi:hypothetical protein